MGEDREISEWNGAGDYLARINNALISAGMAAMNLDVYVWLLSLKLFYREISSVMNSEEREKLYKESIEISEKVNLHMQKQNNIRYQSSSKIDAKLIEALEHFEIELRKVFKDSGLQLKLTDDASKSLK